MSKRAVVYIGNNFIEAGYKCNPVEKKILNLAILKANKKDFPERPNPNYNYAVSMTREEIKHFSGLDTDKDFTNIKNACKALNEKIIIYVDNKGKEFETSSFITSTALKNGVLKLYFFGRVIPFFNKLKERFTSYDLLQTKQFTGKYTIRFYELCKQYEKIGTRTITIDKLRAMYQLEKLYPRFASFRTRVINSAQKELKEKSDIYFEYKQNKEGRNIISITMTIKLNPQHIDTEYYKKRITDYLANNSMDNFYSDFKKYYQKNQSDFSISEKQKLNRIIVKKIEPQNIDEKFLYNFFQFLEPPLDFS